MRVLYIAPALFGDSGVFGGAERYTFELARRMAEQTPTTLLSFGSADQERHDGKLRIRVLRTQCHVRRQPANPLSTGVLSEIPKFDIIHCHQQHIATSSLSALFCKLIRRPVVVSDLGGGGWDISSYISTDRWYDAHLHISEYSRQVFGHAGRPWAHVIYGGVDTDKFSPSDARVENRPVLYVGRLLPHKGINYLIEALPPGLELEIIGKPYDAGYVEHLRTIAAGKAVRFRMDCSDTELVDAYQRCLCLVLPSVYRDMYGTYGSVPELLGQTLLEAMACGRPAMCTDVGSMPEIVQHGVTGYVVPPNDADALRARLCHLRDRPEEAAVLGAAARSRIADQFTWPTVVDRCLTVYQALLTQ